MYIGYRYWLPVQLPGRGQDYRLKSGFVPYLWDKETDAVIESLLLYSRRGNPIFHRQGSTSTFELADVAREETAGLHAFKDVSGLSQEIPRDNQTTLVVGTVVLYGTVVEHERGYRASHAQVDSLYNVVLQGHHPIDSVPPLSASETGVRYSTIGPVRATKIREIWSGLRMGDSVAAKEVLAGLSAYYEAPLVPVPKDFFLLEPVPERR